MDDRAKIPGLALLSLSFTTCVAQAPTDPDADAIVGEWHAVEIDGDKFPMTYSEAPYFVQNGVEMSIDAKLRGRLVNVQESYYNGYQSRSESGSTLVAERTNGLRYRIDVKRDPFGGHGYDEGYDEGYYDDGYDIGYNPTATGYTSYDPSGGYTSGATDATSGGTDGDTTSTGTGGSTTSGDGTGTSGTSGTGGGTSTGGVIGEPGAVGADRPLQIPVPGNFAPAAMVLKCTLELDTLTCERDGDEAPQHWVFRRTVAPDPASGQ